MLLSENYVQYVKENSPVSLSSYEIISIDDLALLPRKVSVSETSSNGVASHDSGHDSYLDDGKISNNMIPFVLLFFLVGFALYFRSLVLEFFAILTMETSYRWSHHPMTYRSFLQVKRRKFFV